MTRDRAKRARENRLLVVLTPLKFYVTMNKTHIEHLWWRCLLMQVATFRFHHIFVYNIKPGLKTIVSTIKKKKNYRKTQINPTWFSNNSMWVFILSYQRQLQPFLFLSTDCRSQVWTRWTASWFIRRIQVSSMVPGYESKYAFRFEKGVDVIISAHRL